MRGLNYRSFATLLVVGLVVHLAESESEEKYGIGLLRASGHDANDTAVESVESQEFCFTYQVNVFELPSEPEKTYRFEDATTRNVCNDSTPIDVGNNTMILLQKHDNCSLEEYINFTKSSHGEGFFLNLYERHELNSSFGLELFGEVGNKTLNRLKEFIKGKLNLSIQIHSIELDSTFFDASILLLWVIASVCVALGSLTGPYQDLQSTSSRQQILEGSSTSSGEPKNVQVSFSISLVLTLVVFISATLLLLYYFYEYLVYFFMAVFCFASGRSTYEILNQIAGIFKLDGCMPRIRGCGIHQILLAAICLALPILWFVFRHHSGIWILQDFLGICFCIHIIQNVRIPNLQICTVLLSMLFIYDIFFVFITPYITSNGKSVMVEVATGGNSGESLPLLVKIPRSQGPSVCLSEGSYSLLGFGDIIIPGFLVGFANSFDIFRGDKLRPYFITTMIGYIVGLASAFVALYISRTGQPALLYIVPCTLIPIFIVGLIRKQFRDLWRGSITITEVEP